MREIKFRGKLIGTGEWVFGAYIGNYGKPFIVSHNVVEYCEEYLYPEFWWRVDRNTVGQYTGLKDKNGREIYEGDLWKGFTDEEVCVVEWSEKYSRFVPKTRTGFVATWMDAVAAKGEVIGNIHDNPELLKS